MKKHHILVMGIKMGLRYMKNPVFRKWVENYNSPTSLTFEERGTEYSGNMVYVIGMKDLQGNEETIY